jgi:hypothetical protein
LPKGLLRCWCRERWRVEESNYLKYNYKKYINIKKEISLIHTPVHNTRSKPKIASINLNCAILGVFSFSFWSFKKSKRKRNKKNKKPKFKV